MIRKLLPPDAAERPPEPVPGANRARGVTKEITIYEGAQLNDSTPLLLVDTPGVGDVDTPPLRLVPMIEAALRHYQVSEGGVDAVLVTTPIETGRLGLGAQIVKAIVDLGFVGGVDKWKNVLLVGTKSDKANAESQTCFTDEVVPTFFPASGAGPFVMVHQDDLRPLRDAISQLPNVKVRYEPPPLREMGRRLVSAMGIKHDDAREHALRELTAEMNSLREAMGDQLAILHLRMADCREARALAEDRILAEAAGDPELGMALTRSLDEHPAYDFEFLQALQASVNDFLKDLSRQQVRALDEFDLTNAPRFESRGQGCEPARGQAPRTGARQRESSLPPIECKACHSAFPWDVLEDGDGTCPFCIAGVD